MRRQGLRENADADGHAIFGFRRRSRGQAGEAAQSHQRRRFLRIHRHVRYLLADGGAVSRPFLFSAGATRSRQTSDLRVARVHHDFARAPDWGARVWRHGGSSRAAHGVDHVGCGLWRHHFPDRAHPRLSPDRHRLLLAPGDPALSRRHLPWRRLYRRASAGNRIFQERTARLRRRPHPFRLSRRLCCDHARRDADVRHLPASGRGTRLTRNGAGAFPS